MILSNHDKNWWGGGMLQEIPIVTRLFVFTFTLVFALCGTEAGQQPQQNLPFHEP